MAFDWNIALGITSPVVTVIGLAITNWVTKKQIIAETEKLKQQVVLDKMEDVPSDLLLIFYEMKNGLNPTVSEKYEKTLTKIFAYGSPLAVSLASTMQQHFYTNNAPGRKGTEEENFLALVYLVLLVVQIKFDLTALITPPIEWFKLKLTDFSTKPDFENKILRQINEVVKLHGLDKRFMVN